LGREGDRAYVRDRDRQGISGTQSAAVPVSEARAVQGTGGHGRREELRVQVRRSVRVKISRGPAESEWLEWLRRQELNPRCLGVGPLGTLLDYEG